MRQFRDIHRALAPFMTNEIKLIDYNIVRRTQKVCVHLACIKNRSLMLMGVFPLTFGSLVPVSGQSAAAVELFKPTWLKQCFLFLPTNLFALLAHPNYQILAWLFTGILLLKRFIA